MSAAGTIGIIGGSGLYELPGLTRARWRRVRTPFGDPSDELEDSWPIRGVPPAPRPRPRIMPSELNFRANIWGLKALGVGWVPVSAVGSMREKSIPDLVIPDQFFDHTRRRASSFGRRPYRLADPVRAQVADALDKSGAEWGRGPPRWHASASRGPVLTREESRTTAGGVDVME
jgi:5'-methylthioadenosine phosphorylase